MFGLYVWTDNDYESVRGKVHLNKNNVEELEKRAKIHKD